MKYEIMNRLDARQSTCDDSAPDTASISITDFGDEKNHFYPQPWLKGVLELQLNELLNTAVQKSNPKRISLPLDDNGNVYVAKEKHL